MTLSNKFTAAAGNALKRLNPFKKGPPSVNPKKYQAFMAACQAGDKATASQMAQKKQVPAPVVAEGLAMFIIGHKTLEGLDTLAAFSGLQRDPGQFVYQVLRSAENADDQLARIKFINRIEVPYQTHDLIDPLFRKNTPACLEILASRRFDPRQDHSTSLLYAATLENKPVFVELLKLGGIPQDALMNGPEDAIGYSTGYNNIASWLKEIYNEQLEEMLDKKLKALPTEAGPSSQPAAPGSPQTQPAAQQTGPQPTSSAYDPAFYAPKPGQVATPAPAALPAAPEQKPAASTIDLTRYAPKPNR